jgi:glycosyltransferase involved in cell wall biosynthesis
MRILIYSQYYWPENFRINEIAQAMSAEGVQVEVLTGKPNYPSGECFSGYRAWGCVQEMHGDVLVHRVPLIPRRRGKAFFLALNYLSFVFSGWLFGSWLLRKKQYDAIFVFAPSPILQAIPAIWVGWLKEIPVVLWVQDLWPESLSTTGFVQSPLILNAVSAVVRWIYRKVDLILVQSRAFIPKVESLAGNTPVEYYPNSFIDSSISSPKTCFLIPEMKRGFIILFAGNLGVAQAIDVILNAAERLLSYAEIRFVIVGDGSRRSWISEEIERRCLRNVELLGSYPLEAMPNFMAKASVLLVTLADEEILRLTVPSKVQAYLSAGRPIIACLNGEGAKLIEEAGAGLTCPAGNDILLAESILQLYQLPEEKREIMGRAGRSYFLKYFFHEKLIKQLIERLALVTKKWRNR